MATTRRPKWHPPPPPTPRILNLPRRTHRRKRTAAVKPLSPTTDPLPTRSPKGKLESLLDQERAFSYNAPPPVVLLNAADMVVEGGGGGLEEEKWRFQAEILRAECKFLRMEKEIAAKKLERERVCIERILKSAVHALISGKKKIREGKSGNAVLEEEIEELARKLAALQRSSRVREESELQNCSSNFDKQAALLQKQLEKLGHLTDDRCSQDMQEMGAVASLSVNAMMGERSKEIGSRKFHRFADVDILRRKMEGLSKGKLLKKMEEEYGSMLCGAANCSIPSSASTSKRYDHADLSSLSFRKSSQETKACEPKPCCTGHCKAIVRRIMEQVRAETEQWSQMQEMLGQVRDEMEELQAARDFWEDRAIDSDYRIQTLQSTVQEWKQKALSLEIRENQLQKQLEVLQEELEKSKKMQGFETITSKELSQASCETQQEKEKLVLTCRVGSSNTASDEKKPMHKHGSRLISPNRFPFREIGNRSPLIRQNSKRSVVPLHSPQHSLTDENFCYIKDRA